MGKRLYALYGGMGGSFGSENAFRDMEECKDDDDAREKARDYAVEEYESYEGMHGVLNPEECYEEGIEYSEEVESWIGYEAKEIESTDDIFKIGEEEGLDTDVIMNYVNTYRDIISCGR